MASAQVLWNHAQCVKYIQERRDTEFKNYSFPFLVFLRLTQPISNIQNATSQDKQRWREESKQFDYEENWWKYCSALDGRLRALAAQEGSSIIIAESSDEPAGRLQVDKERNRQLLYSWCNKFFRPFIRPLDPPREEQSATVMRYADVSEVPSTIGKFLWNGIEATHERSEELRSTLIDRTDTIYLFVPQTRGGDFVLELLVSQACAAKIEDALEMNTLSKILYDTCLFTGMMESKARMAGATHESLMWMIYHKRGDWTIRITLAWKQGWQLSRMFPKDEQEYFQDEIQLCCLFCQNESPEEQFVVPGGDGHPPCQSTGSAVVVSTLTDLPKGVVS